MPSSTTTTTLLKLTTIVSSTYAKPHHHRRLNKCFLRRSQTTTTTAAVSASPPLSNAGVFPPMCSRGLRITPCAPLGSPAHGICNSKVLFRKLGFRFRKNFVSSSQGGGGGGMGRVNSYSKDEKLTEESDELSPVDYDEQNHHRQTPPARLQQSDKLLTLPTILTIGRVAAVPLLVSTFYMNSWLGTTATTSIFIAAAITDWLDGYLARKMNLGTAFGAFLDPVADKLMVAATLVLLCTRPPEVAMFQQLPWLLTVPSIAIIGREITMSAVREWAASQGSKLSEAVAVNNLGKWKTATQMISLTILLATRDSSFTEAGLLVASGVALLYVSAGLALWSLVVYMRKIWKVLLM